MSVDYGNDPLQPQQHRQRRNPRMSLATLIFAMTYVLVSLGENSPRKLDRPTATLLGAVLMVMTGSLTRAEATVALDYRTLAVLFGMMVLLNAGAQT